MSDSDQLEVCLDAPLFGPLQKIGVLSHDRGQVRFQYERAWLTHPARFSIDPDLTLDGAPFFPRPDLGHFGIFLDSSPDRWGQTLMKRRETLAAKDQGRAPRTLHAWDYLLGVQDQTRQGALRFRRAENDTFLAAEGLPAPPVTRLAELAAVAQAITAKRIDDLDALRRWLAVLVSPGASLGGARPKANFTETDGSLWIAKFPARDDDHDQGAWEYVLSVLASRAGIWMPDTRRIQFGDYHTFAVKRFDRIGHERLFYASAMTVLQKAQSEGSSYLDLADFIARHGAPDAIAGDLAQLFRRVVFNVATANRDDHLRNHGFLLQPDGWRLSPAFDVTATPDKMEHVLNLDDRDPRPSLETVRATYAFYGLSKRDAERHIDEVIQVVRQWRDVAVANGISRAELEMMAPGFPGGENAPAMH